MTVSATRMNGCLRHRQFLRQERDSGLTVAVRTIAFQSVIVSGQREPGGNVACLFLLRLGMWFSQNVSKI